jgi:DNA-binding CsgD family transcriptional regulator
MELLERDELVDSLRPLLHQARRGSGGMVLLGGEAGAGKTALLRRFMDDSRAESVVLLGQCDALSTPRALGPLIDIARADPALQRLLDDNAPRDALFRAVLDRLSAGSRSVLLAIEDVHWADEATLDLVRYLARRVTLTRALIVVTYRDDEVGHRHPFRTVLGDLATTAAVHRLTVPRLTPEAVGTLAEGSNIDPDALFARTQGNPFFVTAVITAGGEIPATVRDAVLARAVRLPHDAWAVLEAAAVIGPTVEPHLLAQVAGATTANLEACLESGILEDHGDLLTFRHELAREAVLTAISPPRRQTLHRRVLTRLEAARRGPLHPARLAYHAEEAGDPGAVLRYASEAARSASHLRSHREAADQYERALRFADDLAATERAGLLEALAHECSLTAQIERAVAAREAALEIWMTHGDRRKEGENRCRLALLHWTDARMADAEREAAAAIAILETLPPGRELAMAYAASARLRGTMLDDDEAIALGVRAIALAESLGATETLADALVTVGSARLSAGDDRGREQLERSIQLATAAGLDDLAARGHANLGFGYDEQCRFEIAASHFVDGIAFCVERDLDHFRQHMTAWLARCRFYLGDWDAADELAGTVLGSRDLAPVTRFVALLVEAAIRVRRGQPGAGPLLDEALALAEASGSLYRLGPVHAVRAEAAWLRGDAAAAVREAHSAYDLAIAHRQRWYAGELAYWRWKGADLDQPPALAAEPYRRLIGHDWEGAAAAWDALGCPYEAAWARAEGNSEVALRAAFETFARLGARPAAEMVRQRLRALGARGIPRGPRPETRTNVAGLTHREMEILALLVQGRSNREIADRLYLSPRTVEKHIASIFAKLGVTTRAEAIAAAAAHDVSSQSA